MGLLARLAVTLLVALDPASATLAPHPDETRWWLSAQVNVIAQTHPAFPAQYGLNKANSLSSNAELAISYVATVYAGYQLSPWTELLVDVESAGGNGLSDALGVAGFTNVDVVRNPTLGPTPYLSRAILLQIFPLGAESEVAVRGPLRLATRLPVRRLELQVGKLSTVDFFDQNTVGSDSHLQLMNWAAVNNGAYDYAADTRGYTFGAVLEYDDRGWSARFGEMLMPTVANGLDLDGDLAHARGENLELELRPTVLPGRASVLRILGFLNHARMGSYAQANAAFRARLDSAGEDAPCAAQRQILQPRPCIEAQRSPGRTKAGVGLNLEQVLTGSLRGFVRLGWNDGKNESFAYTEIDDSAAVGMDLSGVGWRRRADRLGVTLLTNGLSPGHREYLSLGGRGFILGDGALAYGRETIAEAYYTAFLWRGVSVAGDFQGILNPGYNRARGPVEVFSLRLHLEI